MNLIAMIIALGTERLWKSPHAVLTYQWLVDYTAWLWQRSGNQPWFGGPYGVLVVVVPGAFVVGLIQAALASGEGLVAWLVNLAFAVAVLIVSIGVRGMGNDVEEYRRALERNDQESAYLHISHYLRDSQPETAEEVNRRLLEVMLIRNNERLLAILFWFAVLGPVGAVIYRSTCQLKGINQSGAVLSEGFLAAVLRLHGILDWIPARITAICYAAIGSFVDSIQQWRRGAKDEGADLYSANRAVLVNGGIGALRLHDIPAERDNDAMREDTVDAEALIHRTVIIWLTVFALLTIVGWLG